jgi:hypothetical protein
MMEILNDGDSGSLKGAFKLQRRFLALGILMMLSGGMGCWDQPSHELDVDGGDGGTTGSTATEEGTGTSTAEGDTGDDTGSGTVGARNSLLGDGWGGFGSSCTDVSECEGYPAAEKRCLQDVMGIVNCPGGYCTACCNVPGEGVCGQGIDCVGVTNAYLVCLERCETDADCRTEDFYVCHEGLYYMETIFTGKYCLPDANHVTPESAATAMVCPWPWLSGDTGNQ